MPTIVGSDRGVTVSNQAEDFALVGTTQIRRQACILAMLLCATSCKQEPPPIPVTTASATDADDARAALFLRMHAQALQASPTTRRTCIAIENGEPTTRLLVRLSGHGLGIIAASRCVDRDGRIVDAISGDFAVQLGLRSFAMREPGKAEGFGMYVFGGLWCGGGTYQLEFRLSKWEVVDPLHPIVC
jgi:hypothetical protein